MFASVRISLEYLGMGSGRCSYVVRTISTIIFEFIDLIKDYTDDGNDVANAKTFLHGRVYLKRFDKDPLRRYSE